MKLTVIKDDLLRWFKLSPARWIFPLFVLAQCAYIPAKPVLEKRSEIPAESFLIHFVDLDLVDQKGEAFDVHDLADRGVLFNFIYTDCAAACPVQTHTLVKVLKNLPTDVRRQIRFVSVSIHPETDTPDKLMQFAMNLQADLDGWTFLTGNTKQIRRLSHTLQLVAPGGYAAPAGSPTDPIKATLHQTTLWLVDRQGRLLQRYQGDPPDPERLVRELGQVSRMALAKN